MGERWSWIRNYKGYYQVSSNGKFKSVSRKVASKGGSLRSVAEKISFGNLDKKSGYYLAHLCKDGKCRTVPVHILVAETFIPNIDGKPEVNHEDGVKTNNDVNNLTWVNDLEQRRHAIRMGLQKTRAGIGEKLTHTEVKTIKRRLQKGDKQVSIASDFNLDPSTISNIKTGKIWSTVA